MSPLSCAEALGLADERLDRALAPGAAAALRAHLAACGDCAAAAAGAERVHGALLGLGAPAPSPAFTDEVVARLDRGPARGPAAAPTAGRWLRVSLSLAATAALAAGVALVLPLEAAAAAVRPILPQAPLPALPAEFASLGDAIPGWAAALGAACAAAGAALQVAAARRP